MTISPVTSTSTSGTTVFPPITPTRGHLDSDQTPLNPTGSGGGSATSPDAASPVTLDSALVSTADTSNAYGPTAASSQLPAATQSSYTVQSNDTIWNISNQVYGSTAYARQLAQANGLTDLRTLAPGQVLTT